MNLEKFLVISGFPGVHKLISSRANGLVIEDRFEKRTRFVSVRQNQVTPLATVAIYTDSEEGSMPLTDVFAIMLEQYESNPPVGVDAGSPALRAYFLTVLPNHDQDRVHINDIKKCLKWFNFMKEKGIFEEAALEAAAEVSEETPKVEHADEAAVELPIAAPLSAETPLPEEKAH